MKVKELIAELLCYDGELDVEVCDREGWIRPVKSVKEEDYREVSFDSGKVLTGLYVEIKMEE